MSDTVATIIIIGACIFAAALAVSFAGYEGQKKGYTSPRGIGAVAAAICVIILLVWAVWARFDADVSEASTHVGPQGYAGVASNAGPGAGNGNCDPACLLAWGGRHGGAAN